MREEREIIRKPKVVLSIAKEIKRRFDSNHTLFKDDYQFYAEFYDEIFFCCVAVLYQTNEHRKKIIEHFCSKLIAIIKKYKITNNEEHLSLLKNQLQLYLLNHITDESAENYLIGALNKTVYLKINDKLTELFNHIKNEISNLSIHSNEKNEVLQNIESSQELRQNYIDQEIKKKLKPNNHEIIKFFIPLSAILFYYNYEESREIENLLKSFLYSFIISNFLLFIQLTSKNDKNVFLLSPNSNFSSNSMLKNFDINQFINQLKSRGNFQQSNENVNNLDSYKQNNNNDPNVKNSQTQQKKYVEKNESPVEDSNSSKKFPKKGKHKTRPAYATQFGPSTLFGNHSKEATQTQKSPRWFSKQHGELTLDQSKIYQLKRYSPAILFVENKSIYYDDSGMTKEENHKFESTASEARFYPGAAEGKNCIHYLGNNIWSIKCNSDYRVLGTTIAQPAENNNNNEQLIYFWKVVNHSKMRELLRDKTALKVELENPPSLKPSFQPNMN